MKAKLIKKGENHYDLRLDDGGLYTSTYQWTPNGNLLSLKNCQAIECGYDLDQLLDEYQSLQQSEWDVEIEMKKVKDETKIVGAVKGVKGSGSKITTYKSVPKLDADGCLILKRI